MMLALTALMLQPSMAQAHPSRLNLLLHGEHELHPQIGLSMEVIAPNLVGELTPVSFLLLDIHAIKDRFTISPGIGWAFKPNEVIATLRLAPQAWKFWSWVDFEVRPQSWNTYWFAQVEFKALDWLHLGLEEESWGLLKDFPGFSHGGGPNILLRWNRFGADLALHARETKGELGAELYVRIHVFLFN